MKFIISLLFFVVYILLSQDVEKMAVIYSILIILNIVIKYRNDNKISYLDVWNLGFIFMVSSEIILVSDYLNTHIYGLTTVRYILIANIMINLGFYIGSRNNYKIRIKLKLYKDDIAERIQIGKRMMNVLLVLSLIYFINYIGPAIEAYYLGRVELLGSVEGSSSNILKNITNGISLIAPIMGAYYFRYYLKYKFKKIIFILILLLCVVPQLLWGTRLYLLYSFVAPILVFVDNKKFSIKNIFGSLIIFLIIVFSSNYIKLNRDRRDIVIKKDLSIEKKIASFGSDEGIVKGTIDIFEYSSEHGYSYGKESAFILYFYIPRSVWPDKPIQLSSWLVREKQTVSDEHSAAYGFWGELLMDFGYFSLIIILLFGVLLNKLEKKKDFHLQHMTHKSILYIAIFPFLFLSVRSPQTAIISLFVILFIYFIISFFFIKKRIEKIEK